MLSRPARLLLLSAVLLLVSCSQAGPAPDTDEITSITLVPTPTSEFHLEEEPVEISLWELAGSYPSCKLPCWWGVVPGQTSENELNQEWARIFSASSLSRPGLVIVETEEGNTFIAARVYYEFAATQLSWMKVETYAAKNIEGGYKRQFGEETYNQFIDGYGLEAVLSDFGLPEMVRLILSIGIAEPNAPDYFFILLSYPERGVIFEYVAESAKE